MKTYDQTTPEISLRRKDGTMKTAEILRSSDIYEYMKELFDAETLDVYESSFVIYLNRSNKTVGWLKVSQGGITGTVVDIRLILKGALDCLATAIILAHNHPSGSLRPSEQDIKLTQRLKQAAEIMDIKLFDHIIITNEKYYSFNDEGRL